MCGDKSLITCFMFSVLGSPPHVRGQDKQDDAPMRKRGSTPACAGTSDRLPPPPSTAQDHPRMCGDKSPFNVIINGLIGSPPHVRG